MVDHGGYPSPVILLSKRARAHVGIINTREQRAIKWQRQYHTEPAHVMQVHLSTRKHADKQERTHNTRDTRRQHTDAHTPLPRTHLLTVVLPIPSLGHPRSPGPRASRRPRPPLPLATPRRPLPTSPPAQWDLGGPHRGGQGPAAAASRHVPIPRRQGGVRAVGGAESSSGASGGPGWVPGGGGLAVPWGGGGAGCSHGLPTAAVTTGACAACGQWFD